MVNATIEPAPPKLDVTPLLPRYTPSIRLPTTNSNAVTKLPTQTSRHWIATFGMNLNTTANNSVITPSDTAELTVCQTRPPPGKRWAKNSSTIASAALLSSEQSSNAATLNTITNDQARSSMYL